MHELGLLYKFLRCTGVCGCVECAVYLVYLARTTTADTLDSPVEHRVTRLIVVEPPGTGY